MSSIQIPDAYHAAFERLIKLDQTSMQHFVAALHGLRPALKPENLAAQIAPKLSDMPLPDVEEIIRLIVSLYVLRRRLKITVKQLVQDLIAAIKESSDLSQLVEWQKDSFSEYLSQILSIEDFGPLHMDTLDALQENNLPCVPEMDEDTARLTVTVDPLVEKEGLLFFRFIDQNWETALDREREARLASYDNL